VRTLITAGTVLTPSESIPNGAVLVADGCIESVGPRRSFNNADRTFEFPEEVLAPGFIDLHIHGAAGHDFMQSDAEAFRKIGRFLARHGTTSYLPTSFTSAEDELLPALAVMGGAIATPPVGTETAPCARPIGIHLEGPFISDARSGVHPAAHIQRPSVVALSRYLKAARGAIRIVTIAPETPRALAVIRDAVDRGITVALGHTNANFEEARAAIDAGARHSTHTFNSMRRMIHREPGVVGAILSEQRMYADIVADGLHVHPPVVDVFLRCKGRDRAILVSDATSPTGMPNGTYHLGNFEVEVDGLRVESHGKLAGSVLTLEVAVQNVMKYAGWTLADAIRLVTINPAQLLGLENKGRITTGADADFVVLSPEGDVRRTFISGQGI
jgi:N-acetylglucosamine-6-phosphate deacetylase